jgi:hypothetical protein
LATGRGKSLQFSLDLYQCTPAGFRQHAAAGGYKRSERPYAGGWSKDWINAKSRKHPAMERAMESIK